MKLIVFTIMEGNHVSFIEYDTKEQEFCHIQEVVIWGKRIKQAPSYTITPRG